jgi:hypothetical protein
VAWPGPTRRIELPGHVRVGNRELRFMSWEIGIRGLDIPMVGHLFASFAVSAGRHSRRTAVACLPTSVFAMLT